MQFRQKRAKASASDAEKPIRLPSQGKSRAAAILKRKITEMDWATSSSSAWMTGAVAAMADPPQMAEPVPISVAVRGGSRRELLQQGGCRQRCEDGGGDDGKGLFSCFQDCAQVQAETEKDYSVTEHFPGGKGNPGLQGGSVPEQQRDAHAQEKCENRSADQGNMAPHAGSRQWRLSGRAETRRRRAFGLTAAPGDRNSGCFSELS